MLNDDSNVKDDKYHLNSLVRLYFLQQYKKSQRISKSISRSLEKSVSLERAKATEPNTYTFQGAYDSLTDELKDMFSSTYFTDSIVDIHPITLFQMAGERANEIGEEFGGYKGRLIHHICNYLSYRSQGYPKKLEEMLSELIGPIMQSDDRAITVKLDAPLYGKDALKLSDIQLIRIQLLASLYGRHIQVMSNYAISDRDDKTVNLLFAISDFIFKFHKRAFSSDSLEKIEFLASTHQDPTIRLILDNVVNFFKDLFLQRIRAGLYGYTFRSEIRNELKYLSAFSPTEMAAFNFTNDESYSLKNTYIAKLKDGNLGNFDLTSFLAEVHEFDEEYALARKEYLRSLKALEANLTLSDEKVLDLSNLNAFFVVRLLLKIGMSYELSNDLDKASAAYEDAKAYCANTVDKIAEKLHAKQQLPWLFGTPMAEREQAVKGFIEEAQSVGCVSVISRLFLQLFQSIFAQAWLYEKLQNNIETSIALIEHSIDPFLEQMFAFHDKNHNTKSESAQSNIEKEIHSSSYSKPPTDLEQSEYIDLILLKAEILNKAGDLYFVKGKPVLYVALEDNAPNIVEYITTNRSQLGQKYLQRAETMYVNGICEVKNAYLNMRPKAPLAATRKLDGRVVFPAFVTRCLCGMLQDISDTLCARLSLIDLWRHSPSAKTLKAQYNEIGIALKASINSLETPSPVTTSSQPFWEWLSVNPDKKGNGSVEQLLSYLSTNHMASNLLYHGGYPENAAREYLRGVDTSLEMLMWRLSLGIVGQYMPEPLKAANTSEETRNGKILLSDLVSPTGLDYFLLYESTRRLAGVLSHKVYEINNENENEVLSFTSRYFVDLVRSCIATLMLASFYSLNDKSHYFLKHDIFNNLKVIVSRLAKLPIDLTDLENFEEKIQDLSLEQGWPLISESYGLFSQCMKQFLEQYRYPIFNRIHSLFYVNLLDLVNLNRSWQQERMECMVSFAEETDCALESYPDLLISVLGRALPEKKHLFALAKLQQKINSPDTHINFNDQNWMTLSQTLREYENTWKTLRLMVDDPDCFSILVEDAYSGEPSEEQKRSLEGYRRFLLSHTAPWTFALHFCNQQYFSDKLSRILQGRKTLAPLRRKVRDIVNLFDPKKRKTEPKHKIRKARYQYINNQNYKNLNNLINIKANHRQVLMRIDKIYSLMSDLNIHDHRIELVKDVIKLQQQQFELKDTYEKLKQLNQLVRKFNAPMYFPHYHTGLLKTLYYLMRRDWEQNSAGVFRFKQNVRREGHDELQKSLASHSQRREYYESIQKLYYFYDDFNDRHFHATQARKMLFSDFAEILLIIHDVVVKDRVKGDKE